MTVYIFYYILRSFLHMYKSKYDIIIKSFVVIPKNKDIMLLNYKFGWKFIILLIRIHNIRWDLKELKNNAKKILFYLDIIDIPFFFLSFI